MWQAIAELIAILGPYLFTLMVFWFTLAVLVYAVIVRSRTGRWPWPLEFLNHWGV